MLKGMSGWHLFVWNLLVIGLWHVTVFIACQKRRPSAFDASRVRYLPREWEHGGRFYRDKLKIQFWKDRVPQFIARDGFSKEHLEDLSIQYVDQFILETCRGEWTHFANSLCVIVVLLINPLLWGLLFTFLVLLGNLPFACIQRYNRFRLQILRRKLIREQRAASTRTQAATA